MTRPVQAIKASMSQKISSIPTPTKLRHDADLDRRIIRDIIDTYELFVQETITLTQIGRALYRNKDHENPSFKVQDLDEKLDCIINQIRRLALESKEVVEINRESGVEA